MAAKNLKYYLENTDEMPTDPKEIEALAQAHMAEALEGNVEQLDIDRFAPKGEDEKGKPSAPEAEKKEVEVKPEVKAEEPKAEEPKAKAEEPKPEEKPEGILARDGKSVIPFAVLANARERAAEAERLAREQAAEIERLKSQKPVEPPKAELNSDELAVLAEDSPTLASLLRAQQAELAKLREGMANLEKFANQQVANEQDEGNRAVQEAIDRNPTLLEWQGMEDPTLWNMASRLDMSLRESPEYKDVPFDDRFAKVVELTKAVLGIKDEPAEEIPEAKPEVKQPSEQELLAIAEKKLAEKKAAMPISLSQIPGGVAPAQDERERVEQMSSVELGNRLLGMKSLEDINAYLNNL